MSADRFFSAETMLEEARCKLQRPRWPRCIYAANVDALTDRNRALALLRRLAGIANERRLLRLPDVALTDGEWNDVRELTRCPVRSYGIRSGEEGHLLHVLVTRTDMTGAVEHELRFHDAFTDGLIYWSHP